MCLIINNDLYALQKSNLFKTKKSPRIFLFIKKYTANFLGSFVVIKLLPIFAVRFQKIN